MQLLQLPHVPLHALLPALPCCPPSKDLTVLRLFRAQRAARALPGGAHAPESKDLTRTRLCARSELHEHFPVVPTPIREYIEEVQRHLEAITAYEGADLRLEDKQTYLRETRHAFGRTALVLSGGGALGAFHIVRAPCAAPSCFCAV